MIPVIVYLAPDDLDALARAAKRDGQRPRPYAPASLSAFVRAIILRQLAREQASTRSTR